MSTYIHGPEFRKYRVPILLLFIFCMVSTMSFLATRGMRGTSAAPVQGFNAGNIISDAVMANANSMTVDEIQKFLTSKNKCNNTNEQIYQSLSAQYQTITWHFENGKFICLAEEKFGDGVEIGQGQTAAEIIHQAAQDYQINPQVLIVLLEKEQGLITDTYPNSWQYRSATGYGCPDTAPCATEYYGFKNQVRKAAAMFRSVLDGGWSNYPAGQTLYVRYNPNASCGGTNILIENRATSALYRYTPYQPNAAALAAGTGTGDACSAYGNRNFYLYFTNWFGSTQLKVEGSLAALPDGEYAFTSAANAKLALGFLGNNAQPANFNLSDQTIRWKLQRDASTGQYYIINSSNNQYLMTQSASVQDGTNVSVSQTATCAKLWKIYQTPDGFLTFESSCGGGMVASIADANVQIGLTNGAAEQKWSIASIPAVKDGLYQIGSSINPSQVLDINSSNSANGAKITLWERHQIEANQTWRFEYNVSGGYYTITNPFTGKALSVSSEKVGDGTTAFLWEKNNSCAQQWKVIANTNGSYSLYSLCGANYALDLNWPVANGSKITLWSVHGGANQQWNLTPVAQPIANGTYIMTSRYAESATADVNIGNDNVTIWARHNGNNQRWQAAYDAATGTYSFQNLATQKYLGLSSTSAKNGTNVQVQSDNSTCATRWYIHPMGGGYYRIISTCGPTMAMDLNGSTANGNNITLWDAHNGFNQQWYFRAP